VYFVTCPKQGLEMEAVVLHRVPFLEYFCPKQGQDLKPSAAPLYPNMGQVPPHRALVIMGYESLYHESLYKYGKRTRNFGEVFISSLVYFATFWGRFQ